MVAFIISVIVLIGIDQAIKYFASVSFAESIFHTFLMDFTYVENRFMFYNVSFNWLIAIVSIALIIIFVKFFFDRYAKRVRTKMNIITFTMIIAGGISNLLDNIVRGFVVDYAKFNYVLEGIVFNLADVFIVVGVVLLAVMYLIEITEEKVESMPEGGMKYGNSDTKKWFKELFKGR